MIEIVVWNLSTQQVVCLHPWKTLEEKDTLLGSWNEHLDCLCEHPDHLWELTS